jgi:translocation and assembly module TamB
MKGVVAGALDGMLDANHLEIEGKAARLSGKAQFDRATQRLGVTLTLEVPKLEPLGPALGAPMAGAATIRLTAAGAPNRLAVNGELDGRAIRAAGISLDRVRLALRLPDLASPKAALDGSFGARGIDGTVALTALPDGGDIAVPDFRLIAAGGSVTGALHIGRDTGLVRGRITGRIPDLARWSAIAGTPLGGSCEFVAGLDTNGGQRLDLSAKATSLASGAGASRLVIGRLDAALRLADLRRLPTVSGQVALTQGRSGAIAVTNARLKVETPRPGHMSFNGDAKGQPLTVGFAGEAALAPAAFELRLDRLDGMLGRARLSLQKPLLMSRRATGFSVSGLDLKLASGRITGSGGLHGDGLELAVDAADLPIAALAQPFGYREVKGGLSASVRVGGNLRAPQGHLTLTARNLDLAGQAPTGLGLAMTGNWDGRDLAARGEITGLTGDSIVFGGSVPLRLKQAPLGISVPADGRLALNLRGKGRLDRLADLLPLGEDRVSGRFAADVAVGGTIASPAASGHLTLTDARWENFASGAVLTGIAADIAGDRDRFQLVSFTATDPNGGHVEARGGLALGRAAGPSIELSARLARFRIAARDEAIVTASGSVVVAGPIGNPKITGRLTIDKGEISLPQAPPSNLARLDVTVIDSKTGRRGAPSSSHAATELPSAALDLHLDAPGPIFVRGHGLDSQWRGRLVIRGTSTAPDITGRLEQIQGSFDLLGKTFQLTRGTIVFGGGVTLDPTLNIVAEASAADITAQIIVSGPASAPKIKLSSTPALPQDEILARVLFGQSVGRISAAQGLQLAQAAAALAGGGLGVLDRLRGKLGLDWLRLGEGPSGPASSILNPALTNPNGTSNAAVSAGKYLMPGVSVGVTQGVSPPTSKVTVQIEVRPHVTVQGEAGQSGNTGIGLNYQYDY